MASGGIRDDKTGADNLLHGEARNHKYTVVDEDDVEITDMTGWEFTWFLTKELDDAVGLTALNANYLVRVQNAAITDVAPLVTVPQLPAEWPAAGIGVYVFQLWRSDTGNEARLSYGKFPVIA